MRFAAVSLLVALTGCTGTSNLCSRVKCGAGEVCDPNNGRCVSGAGGGSGGSAGGATAGGSGGGGTAGGTADGGPTCNPPCSMSQKCDTLNNRCVACLIDAHCSCPNPVCVNGNCLGPPPSDGGLAVQPPFGESCADAPAFTFLGCTVPRSFTFRVDLSNRADDEQGVCSAPGGLGRDIVYALTLEAPYDLDVTVTPINGSTAEPVIYVRKMPCLGQELACTDSGGAFSGNVHLRSRTAGTYGIYLDTYDAAADGEVEVTVTLSAPTPPPNDTCLSAEPITTDGVKVRANLAVAANDEVTTCNGSGINSLDLAWRFVTTATSDIVARVARADDAGFAATPVLELRSDCAPGNVRACTLASPSGVASIRARGMPAGAYYLIVEAWDAGVAGPVDVSVLVKPPSPPLQYDTCNAPRDIVFPGGATFVEWDIDTSSANDDEDGTCNDPSFFGAGGPEYVYHLRLNSPREVTITASATGVTVGSQTLPDGGMRPIYVRGASDADPVIYLRSGTCGGAELSGGCADDPFESAAIETLSSAPGKLPTGDYYLFVESYGGSVGETHITVSSLP